MSGTRLFISHSTPKDDPEGVQRLKDVVEGLELAGYRPMLDRELLKSGDEWRRKVHRMLARCHAGLVLFNDAALESPWVLKETTILAWRASLEKKFRLLAVRLGAQKTSDFKSGYWSPLLLSELQHLKTGKAVDIVNAVTSASGIPKDLGHRTFYDDVIGKLADELGEDRIGANKLEQAAGKLCDDVGVLVGEEWKAKFADLLAREVFSTGPGSLKRTVQVLKSVSDTLHSDVKKGVITIVEPMWVEPDAAALIPAAQKRDQGFRDLALGCSRLSHFRQFVDHYIRRGCRKDHRERIWIVTDATAGNLVADVAQAMRDEFLKADKYGAFSGYEDEELDEVIQHLDRPRFVALPSVADPAALTQLRAQYDNVTFLMYTPELGPSRPAPPSEVRYLEPELAQADEMAAVIAQVDANAYASQ